MTYLIIFLFVAPITMVASDSREVDKKTGNGDDSWRRQIEMELSMLTKEMALITKEMQELKKLQRNSDINAQEKYEHTSTNLNQASLVDLKSDSIVGFTALHDEVTTYSLGETLIFGTTVTNNGDYYNPLSGVFTCPVSGFYLFSASLFTNSNDEAWADIVREGTFLISVFSENEHNVQASSMVITECNTGERVWVEAMKNACQVVGSEVKGSSFAGVLLSIFY